MADQLHFDYYYGLEGEKFQFIRIPKLLVQDKVFMGLSDRAKILYAIMLDIMGSSRKNGWLDKQNRVYIKFSIKSISEALNCSQPTACKAMAELDSEHGIGLIERHKRGQGKPDIIYVKNFISYVENNPNIGKEKTWNEEDVEDSEEAEENSEKLEESSEIKDFEFLNLKNLNSRNLNSKKLNPREQDSLSLEIKEFEFNNTNINKTNNNQTESNLILSSTNIKKPDIWLYPFRPEDRIDVIRQMQMEPDIEHIPTVVLDLTEKIPRVTSFLARKLIEERNGVPKELAFDVPQMTFVIKTLTFWNDYVEDIKHEHPEEYIIVVRCLIEMCCTLKMMHCGDYSISYSNVIDQINRIIHLEQAKYACCSFNSFVECCIDRYLRASKKSPIQNPSNYMKSIIWSAFGEFRTEFDAYVRRTEYHSMLERLDKEKDSDLIYIESEKICIAMSLITSSFNVYAADIPLKDSKSAIIEEVKSFVDTYESVDISDKEKIEYIESNSSHRALDDDISYVNMMSLLIDRNNIVQEYSVSDITEYGKEINIEYDDISFSENEASVSVTVTKTWNYAFSDIESGAVDNYQFELVYEDDNWKIDNIGGISNIVTDFRLQEMGDQISIDQKNKYISEIEDEVKQEIDRENTSDPAVNATRAAYSSANATSYALNYALSPNPNYADFTNLGGDCTNFISQCLYAGGKSMHYGTAYSGNCWYYTTSTNRSSTWTGASQFRSYVTSGSSQLNMSTSDWNNVVNGDIIQMMSGGSAYHSLIITGVAYSSYGRSDLLVCAHTSNRRHVSLSSYYSGTKAYYHVN